VKNASIRLKSSPLSAALLGLVICTAPGIAGAQSLENRVFAPSPYAAANAAEQHPLVGAWSYRSLLNNPDLTVEFNKLRFGAATITLEETAMGEIKGMIGGTGWSLDLKGNRGYGNPFNLRFQGKGKVGDETWTYDYIGYLIPAWPNGDGQRPAIVGSVIWTVPHSDDAGGISPAGFVSSFIAVKQ
jgi:hypothetical protein